MKAISLWQPWATLIAIGAKQYETRSWATNHRGQIAIHATQSINSECWRICKSEPIDTLLRRAGYRSDRYSWRGCLPMGAILAVAELVDVLPIAGSRGVPVKEPRGAVVPVAISDQERALGDWSAGRFAWHLANVRVISPVYCSGRQGLWMVPADVEAELRRQLGEQVNG